MPKKSSKNQESGLSSSTSVETKKRIYRVNGNLKEIVTLHDKKGNVIHKFINPLMVEFRPRDVIQVLVGAALLAIPVGYTEETWKLGEILPLQHVLGFLGLSFFFMGVFVYYNFYRKRLKKHYPEFIMRIVTTYVLSFLVVTLLLSMIQKAPWSTDALLAFKRTVIVTFPCSMSAVVADMLK
jgi:uncharacterized membrane protein